MEFQLADLLEALTDSDPDAPVVVAGRRRHSRRTLDERANRLAHHLADDGIGRGQRVGVYARNRVEWVETMVACWKLGVAPVNVNYRYVADELRHVWRDADLAGLVFASEFAPLVGALADEFPALRTYVVLDDPEGSIGVPYEDALAAASPERGFTARSADDLHVIYTGGTTGLPKGVLWRHEDLYSNLARPLAGIDDPAEIVRQSGNPLGLRTLALAPMMHGGGQYPFVITVFNGGVSVLSTDRSFDAGRVLDLVEGEEVTTLNIIGDAMGAPLAAAQRARHRDPATFETSAAKTDARASNLGAQRATSRLRVITSGGAVLSEPVRAALRQTFPGVVVTGGMGASELGTAAFESGAEGGDGPRFEQVADTAVLDDELEPVPPGGVGRVARTGAIPLGYLGDPERTAATFPVDRRGRRWAIPGDYARVEDDGTFVLLGRGSACINSGGEKIFPDEVEYALASHPEVVDAIVVGAPDPVWGERVVALVEPRPGATPTLAQLQAHCRGRVAGYKVPRALVLGPVRRTEIGKPDYAWAAARVAESDTTGAATTPSPGRAAGT